MVHNPLVAAQIFRGIFHPSAQWIPFGSPARMGTKDVPRRRARPALTSHAQASTSTLIHLALEESS
jgi:hypothetical protein